MQMQRELQGQVQRKKVERRYRERCNKGPERDCLLDFPFCPLCSFAYPSPCMCPSIHQRKSSDRRGRESEC